MSIPIRPRSARRRYPWLTFPLRMHSLALVFLSSMLACNESLKPPPAEPGDLYWDVVLNHRAVQLSAVAPNDTLTLVAVPRNANGEIIAEPSVIRYTSTDFQRVFVGSDGRLQALAPTTGSVWVRATITVGALSHVDSALVQVANSAPPSVLTDFSVDPVPPDSAKAGLLFGLVGGALGLPRVLNVRAVDAGGQPLPGLPVHFGSSDPTIAKIDRVTGVISGVRPGEVTFYASTTAYGVAKADSLPYQIGWSTEGLVQLIQKPSISGATTTEFSPSEIKVGVGAVVVWKANVSFGEIDVNFAVAKLPNIQAANTSSLYVENFVDFTQGSNLWKFCVLLPLFGFSGTPDCDHGGNIVLGGSSVYSPGDGAYRVFTAPGTYEYRSAIHGATGRIIVIDES